MAHNFLQEKLFVLISHLTHIIKMKNKNSTSETEETEVLEREISQSNKDPDLMKAVRIHHFGGSDKLIYELAPIPKIAPDEILIKVYAAGVNPIDWKIREGHLKYNMSQGLPLIPGWDVAGTVAATGILINRFKEGDKVFAKTDIMRNGSYAEYVTVKTNDVAFAPNIDLHTAAGVPLAAQTAWMGLFEVGKLKTNQKILIHGASGGVGTFAVQLARVVGARVTATTSEANIELIKSLGADEVIDYQKEDFSERVKNQDMVFDTIGGDTQDRSWKVLRRGGILVSTLTVDENAAAKHGVTGKTFFGNSNGARLQEIAGLIDKHQLRVIIDREFSLKEVSKAHDLSQSGKTVGKIILRVFDQKNN